MEKKNGNMEEKKTGKHGGKGSGQKQGQRSVEGVTTTSTTKGTHATSSSSKGSKTPPHSSQQRRNDQGLWGEVLKVVASVCSSRGANKENGLDFRPKLS
ncbi:hypothetical protein E2C01_007531 [Portunus trituberculatus]|uniref:Uncharacterized protein n=1 Tax=Portunus trituberculatus TaxID=210409 RepID=A0A5B7CZH4_PORTR|nr:hypothetical protein [Portunus trituberculatus]